ncbi:hypothetical protein Syun_017540 [Stephania yunnanensis]|uniref:Myb/SANT-like domain-containing protein n=1 Tax=Stephania yunnanensis TaxID=152371 RepID=A0AAP0J778_9MAGN
MLNARADGIQARTCSAPNCTCVSIDEQKSQERRNAVTGTHNSRIRDGRNRFSVERSMHIRAKPIPVFSDSQLDLQLFLSSSVSHQSLSTRSPDRYQGYVELMRCNSGFGWDHATKKFTASNEIWEEYFKSHPNQRHYQTETFVDYDDLRIIFRNATASGRYSIGLRDDTDARTFEVEEPSGDVLEDLTYDYDAEAFVQRNEHQQKNLYQPPTVGSFNAPGGSFSNQKEERS